ncbi:MAG: hypothetical protein IJR85_05645 [Synergistaceae bacterium]|nr:hypothetical protein [Synergistaceae bacterium]
MRKFFVSVMILLALSAGAYADVVYSTEDGSLGVVRITSQGSADLRGIQYKGNDDNTLLGSYWDGDDSRIILVSRTTDYTASGDTALIFNPADMSEPLDTTPKVLNGVYNAKMMTGTYNGRGLYFVSGSSVREFSTETFKRVRTYTCKPDSGDTQAPPVKSLAVSRYTVYLLTERANSGDVVMMFDGQLRDDIEDFRQRTAPSGSSAMAVLSNSLMVIAHDTGVDGLSTSGFYEIVSRDCQVNAICPDNDKGFYFAEESNDGTTTYLKHYNKNGTLSVIRTENEAGDCQMIYDDSDGVMCVVFGGKLLVYRTKDDVLIGEFGSSELGGNIRHVASGVVKGADTSDNGGCNFSGLGMLLAVSLLFRRR